MPAEEEAKRWDSFNDKVNAEACRKSDFGWRNTFTFDTDDLNSKGGKFVISRENCSPTFYEDVIRGNVFATSSTISFTWELMSNFYWTFNIDRKTLRGGVETERNFQCTIEDVDISENQI